MRTCILSLALLIAGVSHAQTCPAGGRYTTNGADLQFCLYENITLPNAPDVRSYCEYLQLDDVIGFTWLKTSLTAGYTCPSGSYDGSTASEGYCIYSVTPTTWAEPYCDYLDDGYIGYVWRQCPTGGTFSASPENAYCEWTFRQPLGAQPDCANIDQGVVGYTYPVGKGINMGYRCPGGFTQGPGGDGFGACHIAGVTPGTLDAECGNVAHGQIGYHWSIPQ